MEIKFELSSSEHKDLTGYCKLNNLNPDLIIKKSYLEGFRIEKYGLLSGSGGTVEKEVIKEVIKYVEVPVVEEREVVKIEYVQIEKPVEVEKIIEVIKEVPVDKVVIKEVIKEVPIETVVTKIEYICDNSETNKLLLKIQQLETEMSKKDEELDQLRRNLDVILDKPPVEIIKEVEVIKEVEIPNDKMGMLQETLQVLRKELQTKNERIKELEKINRDLENTSTQNNAVFLRGSNINNRL